MQKIVQKYIKVTIFILSLFPFLDCFAKAPVNSLDQIKKDVTYLASDDLKGRGNFSNDINKAANYIAKRFRESGLTTPKNLTNKNFLQKYKITNVRTQKLNVIINDKTISSDNLTIASTEAEISWGLLKNKKNGEFIVHIIDKDDDFLKELKAINQKGGAHLVLLNPSHKTKFNHYKQHFTRGVTQPTDETIKKTNGGTIVIALFQTSLDKLKSLNVLATNTIKEYELKNVIAILPGKTRPEEIVVFSAHYDHLGFKNHDRDNIYHGADDNASGTAAVLNIAQYYAKQNNNARTILFAAFSAEELGGLGSINFSKTFDPKTITAMVNIEMIGKASKFGAGNLWMTGIEHSNLGELLNQTLINTEEKIHTDPFPEYNLFYRSDNATLARLGVPAHTFSSVQLNNDKHYHQVTDDISTIDFPSMLMVIDKLIRATEPIVNGTLTPSRVNINTIKYRGKIFN